MRTVKKGDLVFAYDYKPSGNIRILKRIKYKYVKEIEGYHQVQQLDTNDILSFRYVTPVSRCNSCDNNLNGQGGNGYQPHSKDCPNNSQ